MSVTEKIAVLFKEIRSLWEREEKERVRESADQIFLDL